MKEDLGFEGDQLNQIFTCFTVGYVTIHSQWTLQLTDAVMSSVRSLQTSLYNTSNLASGSLS